MEVYARELRVVVEHLFEVGHQPTGVGGVSVEPAPELVADPPVGHLVEREANHRAGPRVAGRHTPEHVFQRHRLGELRCPAPRSVAGVEAGVEGGVDRPEERAVDHDLAAGRHVPCLLHQGIDETLSRGGHLVPLRPPRL